MLSLRENQWRNFFLQMTMLYTKHNTENNDVPFMLNMKNLQKDLEIWVWKSSEIKNV